jgi:phosphatidylethanolamine-binding protein (PEBP) family uncharacterized protein
MHYLGRKKLVGRGNNGYTKKVLHWVLYDVPRSVGSQDEGFGGESRQYISDQEKYDRGKEEQSLFT